MDRMEIMTQDVTFRNLRPVRCIGVTDICIGLFMITYFARGMHWPNSFHALLSLIFSMQPTFLIFMIVFGIYTMQIFMALVLLSATFQKSTALALYHCRKWSKSSRFLQIVVTIELMIYVAYSLDTGRGSSAVFTVIISKIIFRICANLVVKMFMNDIIKRQCAANNSTPMTVTVTVGQQSAAFMSGMLSPTARISSSTGPPSGVPIQYFDLPPTYEEAIRDKSFTVVTIPEGTTTTTTVTDSERTEQTQI